MPDELKPCPNQECPNPTELNCGHAGGCWWVSCCCGVRSPAITRDRKVIETRESAIASWNALPRSPHWTEYDGTEATLPPKGSQILVRDSRGRLSILWEDCEGEFPIEKGEKWTHVPEGGNDE